MNVYLLTAGPYAKIGKANRTVDRVAQLQTACPEKITIRGVIACDTESRSLAVERALHDRLRNVHTYGEWFQNCPRVALDFYLAGRRRFDWKANTHGDMARYGITPTGESIDFGVFDPREVFGSIRDSVDGTLYGIPNEHLRWACLMRRACERAGSYASWRDRVGYAAELKYGKDDDMHGPPIGYYLLMRTGFLIVRFDGFCIEWDWPGLTAIRAADKGWWPA